VLPVVSIIPPLVQQVRTPPQERLSVLRVQRGTVLLVLPVVTIPLPLVQQARTPREQLRVLSVEKASTMTCLGKPLKLFVKLVLEL